MPKINADSNRSFMCHQTIGTTRKIQIGNTTYIVKSVFKNSGPTKADCIEYLIKKKIKQIGDN